MQGDQGCRKLVNPMKAIHALTCIVVMTLVAGLVSPLIAQTKPSPAPTSVPTTAPATTRARIEATVPPGFVKVSAGERHAMCEPANEAWVKEVMTKAAPATRPTTMPSDLTAKVKESRDAITKQLMADLAITDKAAFDKAYDTQLLPTLAKYDAFRSPIIFLVCSNAKLKEIVKGGWTNPRYRYNRAMDDVQFSYALSMNMAGPMDDEVLPVNYDDTTDDAGKRSRLEQALRTIEASLMQSMADDAQNGLQQTFAQLIAEQTLIPMSLKPGQEWLGFGINDLYSYRCATTIIGVDFDRMLAGITTNNPQNPIRSETIDLLHPTAPDQLRREAAPYYIDSMRRKSNRVFSKWLTDAPAGSLTKVIAAVKAQKPADGEALVKIIKEASGIDLTDALKNG